MPAARSRERLTAGAVEEEDSWNDHQRKTGSSSWCSAGMRARQLLTGALPRETGEKKVTIAQREVLRRKVEKVEEDV